MSRGHRLTETERLSIAKERAQGVAAADLAARYGIANRSDALRCLILAADDILHPDDAMTEALRSRAADINRVGNNINQVARRLNEAKLKGERLPYTAESHGNIRKFAGLVLDMADQLQALLMKRRADLTLKITKALAPLLPDREHRG